MEFEEYAVGGFSSASAVPKPLSTKPFGPPVSTAGDQTMAKLYREVSAFVAETTALGNTALFVSAGGYHHHMAMNVWNSRGAGRRADTLGLGRVEITVPDADALGAARERLTARGVSVADDGRGIRFDDPWANRITLTPAASLVE